MQLSSELSLLGASTGQAPQGIGGERGERGQKGRKGSGGGEKREKRAEKGLRAEKGSGVRYLFGGAEKQALW
jgi:hypothetical protein